MHGVTQYRSYLLPEQFWAALEQVRNYLIQDDVFTTKVYHPTLRDQSLREAFDFMDTVLYETMEKHLVEPSKP